MYYLYFVFDDCICISKGLGVAKLMRWVGGQMGGLTLGWEPFFRLIWDTYMMKDNQINDNDASP